MEQAIYGDLYFAVNFTMDTLALCLTARLLHLPAVKWKLALGGGVGALYSVASLFLPEGNPLSLLTALMIPALLCLIAFGWQSGRAFAKQFGAFWVISLLLGGIMTAVCYGIGVWGKKQVSVGGKVQPLMGDLPFWGVIAVALLSGAVISFWLRRRRIPVQTVEVRIEEISSLTLSALVDSGNRLTEPLSGLPVIVVDRSYARRHAQALIPSELTFLVSDGVKCPSAVTPRLRLIPARTASGERILYGFVPRQVFVSGQPRRACIAFSAIDAGGDYTAILPTDLL